MRKQPVDIVRDKLKEYADRGAIGRVAESTGRSGKTEFAFRWMHNRVYTIVLDTKAQSLTIREFLPNVSGRSPVHKGLNEFLVKRADKATPLHQRIDTRKVDVKSVNRKGVVSISFVVKNNQYAYAIQRLVNLLKQTFTYLELYQQDYMFEHFDMPQE